MSTMLTAIDLQQFWGWAGLCHICSKRSTHMSWLFRCLLDLQKPTQRQKASWELVFHSLCEHLVGNLSIIMFLTCKNSGEISRSWCGYWIDQWILTLSCDLYGRTEPAPGNRATPPNRVNLSCGVLGVIRFFAIVRFLIHMFLSCCVRQIWSQSVILWWWVSMLSCKKSFMLFGHVPG